jgi:hypothetical protein
MMTLLDYPKATLSHGSSLRLSESLSATFSKRVWELHHVIANPHSSAVQAKSAKRRLLRELANSKFT